MSTTAGTMGRAGFASKTLHLEGVATYLVPIGRALYALIFIVAAFGHFSRQEIGYGAEHGVPLAGIAVPLAGLVALAGGLSILLGYRARMGAWLLVLFLVPV